MIIARKAPEAIIMIHLTLFLSPALVSTGGTTVLGDEYAGREEMVEYDAASE